MRSACGRPRRGGGQAALVLLALVPTPCAVAQAPLGAAIRGFQLEEPGGAPHPLDRHGGRIVVLAFWSFKCPVALGYTPRIAELADRYADRGVDVLAVGASANESGVEIQRNAANLRLAFPVLIDRDGLLAEKLGVTHTPSVFVLDRSGALRYRGALDNNKRPGEAGRASYAADAIDALLAGSAPPAAETRQFGCALRRRSF